jgi:DNA excision repair protein ERCC-3
MRPAGGSQVYVLATRGTSEEDFAQRRMRHLAEKGVRVRESDRSRETATDVTEAVAEDGTDRSRDDRTEADEDDQIERPTDDRPEGADSGTKRSVRADTDDEQE